jgi:hypothetical protein
MQRSKDAECAAAACPAKAGQVLQLVAPFQSKVSSTHNEAAPSIGPRGCDGQGVCRNINPSLPRCFLGRLTGSQFLEPCEARSLGRMYAGDVAAGG